MKPSKQREESLPTFYLGQVLLRTSKNAIFFRHALQHVDKKSFFVKLQNVDKHGFSTTGKIGSVMWEGKRPGGWGSKPETRWGTEGWGRNKI